MLALVAAGADRSPHKCCGHELDGAVQKINAVDLYCGCGGMSFVDQKGEQVHIQTRWAVDSVKAMCCSFQVNYPDATVSHGLCHGASSQPTTGLTCVLFCF